MPCCLTLLEMLSEVQAAGKEKESFFHTGRIMVIGQGGSHYFPQRLFRRFTQVNNEPAYTLYGI